MNVSGSRIQKEGDVKAEKWSLPSVSSGRGEVFRQENAKQPKEQGEDKHSSIPTADEIEQWHKQAREEGYQDGIKQAQQDVDELKKRLLALIHFFDKPLQSLNEEVEQQLTLLAVTLAQQLVRREIRTDPGEIVGLIRESVQLLPGSSRNIRISLHPEDAAMLRNTLQLDKNEEEQGWKLVEDPMITRGGCEIKADKSVINATLEKRLQSLAASVLGGERTEDRDEADVD
jgi:flagellar assembly protein FliH